MKYYIAPQTVQFLQNELKGAANAWLASYDTYMDTLCTKWGISICDVSPQSHFGTVFFGYGTSGFPVVIKTVCPQSSRFWDELASYQTLRYSALLKLLDFNSQIGAFLLPWITPLECPTLIDYKNLFDTLYAERQEPPPCCTLKSYEKQYRTAIALARSIIGGQHNADTEKRLCPLIDRSNQLCSELMRWPHYLLHGDAHQMNIAKSAGRMYLYDPIGYTAPFAVEYARLLGTLIRVNGISGLDIWRLAQYFCPISYDIRLIMKALCVDVTLRTCNTFFEGNTSEEIKSAIHWCEKVWHGYDVWMKGRGRS